MVEVEGEAPEGEGGGEDVGVGEGALREPDWVDGGEETVTAATAVVGEVSCEVEDAEQRGGGDHADEGAGSADDESGEVPPAGEEDGGQRRVGVGDGGLRDEGAGAEEVPRGGDVVAGLVPEVGEAEEGEVGEVDGDEEERVEHPERDVGGWRRPGSVAGRLRRVTP